ncbi:hypothetical protein Leryth_008519 [Lithospermum erythrorhizon]|nr:hypothetical protein Leryth_008519 [Lithospermum erythrorhizon]
MAIRSTSYGIFQTIAELKGRVSKEKGAIPTKLVSP